VSDTGIPANRGGRLEFVQQLRGLASLIVVFGAHLLGVFWLAPAAVRLMIGVPTWEAPPPPSFVVWLQQFPQIGFGHLGVSTFFLISGFVIPFSVKALGARRFLVARFFRIYPVYWVGLACGLVALHIAASVWGTAWTLGARHIALQAMLIRDVFWIPSIDQISWTLEIEVKFYLLCAVMASVLRRSNLLALICVAFGGGILMLWSTDQLDAIGRLSPGLAHAVVALQMNWVYISFMLIGVAFHFHHVRAITTKALWLSVLALFGMFWITWVNGPFAAQVYGPYNYAASLIAFTVLYRRRDRPIRSRILHFFGDISYPLYVVHPLVGYVGLALALKAGLSPVGALAIVVPIILGGAYLLHRIVETPSIDFGHSLVRGKRRRSQPNSALFGEPRLAIVNYAHRIWASRYFWSHLVGADLRAKYRRSSLGLLWSVIHPLALTGLLSLVMSRVFGSPILEYAPFVFSGLIFWEFVSGAVMTGCNAFINAEGYIRQFPQPLLIYSLRSTLASLTNFALGASGLLIWIAVWRPENVGIAILSLPFILASYFTIAWPMATLTAFYGTRFRDLPQFLVIALQAVWYISPVFFEPRVFRSGGLGILVDWNPIYYMLQILRAPFIDGVLPSATAWSCLFGCVAVTGLWAIRETRASERSLVLYL
jgi:lipopolysaccharide transport system permease protein